MNAFCPNKLETPMEESRGRVLIVSDTLPLRIVENEQLQRVSSGITSRLSMHLPLEDLSSLGEEVPPLLETNEFTVKIGGNHAAAWIGSQLNDRKKVYIGKLPRLVDEGLRDEVISRAKELDCIPVLVEESISEGHWEGYCRGQLWPAMNYNLWEGELEGRRQQEVWADYATVNEIFSNVIMNIWQPNDIIWILDYALFLLPQLLRDKVEEIAIGLYLRSPFPASEIFRCLPNAKEILIGMLGANVIGFQTYGYLRHFASSCTRILGLESSPRWVDNEGIPVELCIQPVGIDIAQINQICCSQSVMGKMEEIMQSLKGKRIIFGIESVDQISGIIHKLKALEILFKTYPETIGSIVLIQLIRGAEGGGGKSKLEAKMNELMIRLNSTYGTIDYTPIQLQTQQLCPEEYYAMLKISDLLLLTAERDSISTVCHEFIVAQQGTFSLPLISEFLGTSSFLPAHFSVNPWDHKEIAVAIKTMLDMTFEEKKHSFRPLLKFVEKNSVQRWVDSFIWNIERTSEAFNVLLPTEPLTLDKVMDSWEKADKRLILLDYDGTIAPIAKVPRAAIPTAECIRALKLLISDTSNTVYIISGRDGNFLDQWLGSIPRLGLSAEHGCFLRPVNNNDPAEGSSWISIVNSADITWHEDVKSILEFYTERTPGSFIEEKRASITWHFRLSDPDFGSWQAKEVQSQLEQLIASRYPVDIVPGKKNLEIRPQCCNKGEIVRSLLERHGKPEFILCIGDDRTDEDMFRALNDKFLQETLSDVSSVGDLACFTCTVGRKGKKTMARYRLGTPDQVLSFLLRISVLTSERTSVLTM